MKKVLIMEDDALVRKTITWILKRAKFEVIEADNGETGFDLALESLPDLIISDIMMPKLNGLQVFIKLSENKLVSHIPFIILSGSKQFKIAGNQLGIKYFLDKPINFQELLGTIKVALKLEQVCI